MTAHGDGVDTTGKRVDETQDREHVELVARAMYAHRQAVGDFPEGLTDWDDLPEPWRDEWREAGEHVARALADAELLAPAPLREEWGIQWPDGTRWDYRDRVSAEAGAGDGTHDTDGTVTRRCVSDWEPVDRAEGDGR